VDQGQKEASTPRWVNWIAQRTAEISIAALCAAVLAVCLSLVLLAGVGLSRVISLL
jgi:hypothetical protein